MQLIKHSIKLYGHATSLTLEKEFWDYLHKIAHEQNTTITHLLEKCDQGKYKNFSSNVRVQILKKALGHETLL